MNINHQGMIDSTGLTCELLGPALPHRVYARVPGSRGVIQLCQPGACYLGVLVDVSPQKTTGTVEVSGMEWVDCDGELPASGEIVYTSGDGKVSIMSDEDSATEAQKRSGIWQVDDVETANNRVLIWVPQHL